MNPPAGGGMRNLFTLTLSSEKRHVRNDRTLSYSNQSEFIKIAFNIGLFQF